MRFNGVGETAFIEGNMNAKERFNILRKNLFNSSQKLAIPNSCYFQKSGVALTQLSLTLHYSRRVFYYQFYIHVKSFFLCFI